MLSRIVAKLKEDFEKVEVQARPVICRKFHTLVTVPIGAPDTSLQITMASSEQELRADLGDARYQIYLGGTLFTALLIMLAIGAAHWFVMRPLPSELEAQIAARTSDLKLF